MATKKKLLQAAAGQAGGAALNVEEVFSTYLYETASSVAVNNGIDLSGEGGLVWIKTRDIAENHFLNDTARGTGKALSSDLNSAESTTAYKTVSSFNSNGYTAKGHGYGSSKPLVSWTFRKAPKFFDVVTYTGNGTTNRQISHDLGSAPGCIIVKRTNGLKDWAVYHRGKGNTHYGTLNTTEAFYDNATWWQDTDPTSTNFTVGNSAFVNANGDTYVAYLFAHNDGDGDFGPNGNADIIKCGSYTGNGLADGPEIDLGFEPQWVMIKATQTNDNWNLYDSMRGLVSGGADALLKADKNWEENPFGGTYQHISPLANGFKLNSTSGQVNSSGFNYIYIAIRRGPMGIPESATDVFAIDTSVNASFPRFTSNFPVDFAISTTTNAGDPRAASSRLTSGKWMRTNDTNAESTNSAYVFDSNDGYFDSTLTNGLAWMWKRAPGYFDVVCYTGTGNNSTRMVDHNLTVKPEMVWIKRRDDLASWFVTTESLGVNNYLNLESNGTGSTYTNIGAHTATQFSARGLDATNGKFVAYLFATAPGVSKVGSYTGNGSSQTIDCGFSSGARFVLIKQTDTSGTNWFVFDSERGIVSGNDSALRLNTTDAAVTNEDAIDPVSSGFSVTNSNGFIDTNNSGGTYIFYAIA